MASIDIFNVQPHVVSRDMRGYSVFLYGEPKSGKTTTACKFPKHLLLAAEKGYAAIPGAMAIPINSWGDFKKALRQLKEEKAKTMFETIIVDTVDIAYDYCTKYVCVNNNADTVSDIPYGKGYSLIAQEFDEALRAIVQMGYGLVLISHSADKTFTDEQGQQYNKIVPTLDKRANNVCSRLCDIIGYSRSVEGADGEDHTYLFMRGTTRFEAGSRFKYTPNYIEFSYKNLANAIGEAIDKQAVEEGEALFTDERDALLHQTNEVLDYDTLMETATALIQKIASAHSEAEFNSFYYPRITEITERRLGRGGKISQCRRDQVEVLELIIMDLEDLSKK